MVDPAHILRTLAPRDFDPLLATELKVRAEPGATEFTTLELAEVKSLPAEYLPPRDGPIAYSPGRSTAFSLLFRGEASAHLAQQTYWVDHPILGEIPLFLVPVGQDPKGTYYESVLS